MGDGVGDGVEGSGRSFSDEAFQLGEDLLDGIEVGRIFGKEKEARARGSNCISYGFSFVRSQIVEHDDVVALEGRDQELFDIGEKELAVDGTVEHAWCDDAVTAKTRNEGQCLAMTVRHLRDQSPASGTASKKGCWPGSGAGFQSR